MFILPQALLLVAVLAALAVAIPTWDSFASRDAISTLVPGSTPIEALGRGRSNIASYLSVAQPRGVPGDVVIDTVPSPPLFYISPRDGQLYHIVNETTVLHVSVYNTTTDAPLPGQGMGNRPEDTQSPLNLAPDTPSAPVRLALSKRREGLTGGAWRWQGTMLYYDLGKRTNYGLFYYCFNKSGMHGLYMFLEPSPTPAGCIISTLHSFGMHTPRAP